MGNTSRRELYRGYLLSATRIGGRYRAVAFVIDGDGALKHRLTAPDESGPGSKARALDAARRLVDATLDDTTTEPGRD